MASYSTRSPFPLVDGIGPKEDLGSLAVAVARLIEVLGSAPRFTVWVDEGDGEARPLSDAEQKEFEAAVEATPTRQLPRLDFLN